jgi:hypothetical protein
MKLTQRAKESLTRPMRLELCLALGFSEVWINKLIENNKDNGPLTTAKAVMIIQGATGLETDQILEETKKEVA